MKRTYDKLKQFFQDFYLVLVLIFLYAPIAVMMVLSFNSSKSRSQWGGFTTQWYKEMFESPVIMEALYNTLMIAFLSALIATFKADSRNSTKYVFNFYLVDNTA